MIEVEGAPTRAGRIDLSVAPGEVVLLRGSNGSGKTSLLRSIAGLDAPLAPRRVRVADRDPAHEPAHALARLVTLATQDARDGLVGLTVEGEARLRRRATPPPLAPLAHRDVGTLSAGEARRVLLSLSGEPQALLLDEPAEGLDADGRARLRALVISARARGAAVLAADHGDALRDLATRVVRLDAERDAAWPRFEPEAGPRILAAPATTMRLGDRRLALPAVALGAGVHALVGHNGSGKTTLLRRLSGIAAAGGVTVDGAPPRAGTTVRMTADAFVRERVEDELAGCEASIADALVPAELRARHPLTLSGGEARRIQLTKALGRRARVYLLDEPDAHLDADARAALGRILRERADEGACIVVATHDASLAAACSTTLSMEAA